MHLIKEILFKCWKTDFVCVILIESKQNVKYWGVKEKPWSCGIIKFPIVSPKIAEIDVAGAPTNYISGWLQYQPTMQSISCNISKCSLF
jgi:hypothetical protein